jgi:hypothetical protein
VYPLVGGVEPVAEQVQEHASDLLRRQLDWCDAGVEIAFQRNVEVRILGAGTVIGEVQRLVDEGIEIDLAALARHPARLRVDEAALPQKGRIFDPALGRSQMCFAVRHCGRERAGLLYSAAAADGAARVSGAAGLGMS